MYPFSVMLACVHFTIAFPVTPRIGPQFQFSTPNLER